MLFGLVRVGAVVRMRVRDFDDRAGEASLVLREKGGKERRLAPTPNEAGKEEKRPAGEEGGGPSAADALAP
jgi:hypothetical protein